MRFISSDDIEKQIDYQELINELEHAFSMDYNIPKRHHHQYPNPKEGIDSTLLLMPAWDDGNNLGVKVVNVSPNNAKHKLPSIQGVYLLFDQHKGTPKAAFDAKVLTNKRTAAASALASKFLSREKSSCLLMIGTGALAPELIKAHASVRPVNKVYVWGRQHQKAQKIADSFKDSSFEVIPIQDYQNFIPEADIVSCATLSSHPLIFGKDIVAGQHYDLVGAYKPDMREADDEFISAVSIHVDTFDGATTETGDLVIPLSNGIIKMSDICSELSEMCKGIKKGRVDAIEITCFKSVGHALEDLAAATLIYSKI